MGEGRWGDVERGHSHRWMWRINRTYRDAVERIDFRVGENDKIIYIQRNETSKRGRLLFPPTSSLQEGRIYTEKKKRRKEESYKDSPSRSSRGGWSGMFELPGT